jgi:hypothetical protein
LHHPNHAYCKRFEIHYHVQAGVLVYPAEVEDDIELLLSRACRYVLTDSVVGVAVGTILVV